MRTRVQSRVGLALAAIAAALGPHTRRCSAAGSRAQDASMPATCLTNAWSDAQSTAKQRKQPRAKREYWAQPALKAPLFDVRDPDMNPQAHKAATVLRGRKGDDLTNSVVMQLSGWTSQTLVRLAAQGAASECCSCAPPSLNLQREAAWIS